MQVRRAKPAPIPESVEDMSTVDFIVAVVMILSIVLSVLRGFTREVLTLVALGGAVAAAYFGLPVIEPAFRHLFEDAGTARIAGGIIVFFVVLIALSLLGHQIGKLLTKAGLGPVDRMLGPVFGIARAVLLLCILYVGLQWFLGEGNMPDAIKHARSTPLIAKTSNRLVEMLPEHVQALLQPDKDKNKDKKKMEDDLAPDDKATEKPDADTVKAPPPPPPPPPPPEKPAAAPDNNTAGYGNTERTDMNRLIQKDGKTK